MIKKLTKCILLNLLVLCLTAPNLFASSLLDNMEDGDNGNRWSGEWFTYDDSANGGDSSIWPLTDAKGGKGFVMSSPGYDSYYCAKATWTLGFGYVYCFVGVGTNLTHPRAPVDCSAYSGVRLRVKGTGKYQLKLVMWGDNPGEEGGPGDCASYRVEFAAPSDWTLKSYNWEVPGGGDFSLPGWGKPRDFDPTKLVAILIQTAEGTPAGTSGEIYIDDLAFLPYTEPPAKVTTTGIVVDNCDDGDNVNAFGGYWRTYNDAVYGGNTIVTPSTGTTFTMTPGGANNTAYAAKFSWTLNFTTPIAGMETSMGPNETDVYDASAYKGIKFYAKATKHHILKLVMSTDQVASYQVGIPPSETWTEYVFRWSDFSLPASGKEQENRTMANYPLDLTKISKIQIQQAFLGHNPNGTSGECWIDEIAFTAGDEQPPIGENRPPNTPSKPFGYQEVRPGQQYPYSTSATDPDGDQVKYTFDWGDGTTTDTPFVNSGVSATAYHSWTSTGTYQVKAKATDSNQASSGWSDALTVTVKTDAPPPPTEEPKEKVYPTDSPFNPAKGQKTIFKNLSSGEKIHIYSLTGELVATLNESGGQAEWSGKDKDGNILPSAVYFFKTTGGKKGKVVIIK